MGKKKKTNSKHVAHKKPTLNIKTQNKTKKIRRNTGNKSETIFNSEFSHNSEF